MKSIFLLLFSIITLQLGAQWRIAYQGAVTDNEVKSASFISPSTGYIATEDWIGLTLDSGHTFQRRYITLSNVDFSGYPVNLLFGFTPEDIHVFSVDTLLVSGDYGWEPTVLRSVNGGVTWKVVFHRNIPFNTSFLVNAIWQMTFPGNGSTGFAIHGDQVLKTTNRGQSWQVALQDPNKSLFDIAFASSSVGYAAGPNRLWKTTNAGANWAQITNFTFEIQEMAVFDQYVFINTFSDDNFFSSNGGSSWQQANTEEGQQSVRDMYYINDSTGYGATGGIVQTRNRGKTWELMQGSADPGGNSYSINKLFFFDNQLAWACTWSEGLLITSNGGGGTYPRALFDVNTNTVCADNTVRLINQGHNGYGYQWFRNNVLFATTYNASYTVGTGTDEIKLVVSNTLGTDTLIKTVDAASNTALSLNSHARRDTVCSNGPVYFDIFNSRTDVLYQVGRPCCGYGAQVLGNGSTLTLAASANAGEDTSTTYYISAYINGPCGVQTASASHTVKVVMSDPPTTSIMDTICTQNTFYIKIPNSRAGYEYWADPGFAKVNGTGGTIQLPCRVNMASSSFIISGSEDLLTNYRFPVYVRHASQFCGGSFSVTEATMIGRRSRADFEINGYDWLTGTDLSFQNKSKQSETYLWRFPDGANNATSNMAIPTGIAWTAAGNKIVKLISTTHEGCSDSATRTIEIITATGTALPENICPGAAPGNVADSLKGRQYFVNRTIYEDKYGSRIIGGGYTGMIDLNHFYPRGYEGWFAAKYSKDGQLLWRLQQPDGDEMFSFNQNTHIVIEHAVGDSLGYTYLLGHAFNRSRVTAANQEVFPIPRACGFVLRISPAGRILWVKTFNNRAAFTDDNTLDYAGGSLLAGKNDDIYIVTNKSTGQRFFAGNTMLYDFNEGLTGVIVHLDKEGNVLRKRTFPVTYNNLRRFNIYTSDSYDAQPPAVWDENGRLVVYGELNVSEMTGNAIDGVTVPFSTSAIRSALLSFDTASLQVTAIRPVYKTTSAGQSGISTESFALGSGGNYYASYSQFTVVPTSTLAYLNDTLKPKSFIAAYNASGNLVWTRQTEGLQPKSMIAFNDRLKVAGSNYTYSGFTNGNLIYYSNQSPTYHSVKKLTAIGDVGAGSGTGAYGQGSLDLAVASLQLSDGQLISVSHLGSVKEDESVTMRKGYGDQVWVAGTVGSSIRHVLNFIDTSSTVYTYKVAVNNNCTAAAYSNIPGFLKIDLIRNQQYCLDSTIRIYWSSNTVDFVNIFYSINGGSNYSPIAGPVSSSQGFYSFNAVQAGVSGSVKFKIEGAGNPYTDTLTVQLFPKATPVVSITTPATSICTGATTTFTATPVNGGATPSYQWYINNALAGTNSSVFSWQGLNNNDQVKVRMTSNAPCAVTPSVFSNIITVTVSTAVSPSVSIGGNTTVNSGSPVVITATPVNEGATPAYQWQDSTLTHGWQNIPGANSPTINYTPAATGDKIRCILTSSISCAAPVSVTSQPLTFTVNTVTAIDPVPADKFGIHLYPNPASGIVYIDTLKASGNWERLDIVSMDGKNKFISVSARNQSRISFNASRLSSGIYIALLRRRNGETVYIRFVKY